MLYKAFKFLCFLLIFCFIINFLSYVVLVIGQSVHLSSYINAILMNILLVSGVIWLLLYERYIGIFVALFLGVVFGFASGEIIKPVPQNIYEIFVLYPLDYWWTWAKGISLATLLMIVALASLGVGMAIAMAIDKWRQNRTQKQD